MLTRTWLIRENKINISHKNLMKNVLFPGNNSFKGRCKVIKILNQTYKIFMPSKTKTFKASVSSDLLQIIMVF